MFRGEPGRVHNVTCACGKEHRIQSTPGNIGSQVLCNDCHMIYAVTPERVMIARPGTPEARELSEWVRSMIPEKKHRRR